MTRCSRRCHSNALQHVDVDYRLPLRDIPGVLTHPVAGDAASHTPAATGPSRMQEVNTLMQDLARHAETGHPTTDTRKPGERAKEFERQAAMLRAMVSDGTGTTTTKEK
jgi:hypothetical protein